uniref:Ubiquitin carboxyl-terminal hydrolase n=1 Tax=Strigamia maritima TaxID=126957 RepID=T1J3Y3_STRMM
MATDSKVTWLPLESNPDVMNKFIRNLGVPASWQLVDVLGLDPELLQMVPQPVLAVLLLFPYNDKIGLEIAKEDESADKAPTSDLYFIKQTISNACGTIALIHALANNVERIQLDADKSLKKFIDATKTLAPVEKAKILEVNEEICSAHKQHAQEGQTSTPNPEEPVSLHFVTLVNVDNFLFELDGRKTSAVNHGATTEATFLEDAAKVCKKFIERDPEEVHFSVVALTAAQGDN